MAARARIRVDGVVVAASTLIASGVLGLDMEKEADPSKLDDKLVLELLLRKGGGARKEGEVVALEVLREDVIVEDANEEEEEDPAVV